jgi:hypothetical protein
MLFRSLYEQFLRALAFCKQRLILGEGKVDHYFDNAPLGLYIRRLLKHCGRGFQSHSRYRYLCVSSCLATDWFSVQGVTPAMYRIEELKKGPRPRKGCRAINNNNNNNEGVHIGRPQLRWSEQHTLNVSRIAWYPKMMMKSTIVVKICRYSCVPDTSVIMQLGQFQVWLPGSLKSGASILHFKQWIPTLIWQTYSILPAAVWPLGLLSI